MKDGEGPLSSEGITLSSELGARDFRGKTAGKNYYWVQPSGLTDRDSEEDLSGNDSDASLWRRQRLAARRRFLTSLPAGGGKPSHSRRCEAAARYVAAAAAAASQGDTSPPSSTHVPPPAGRRCECCKNNNYSRRQLHSAPAVTLLPHPPPATTAITLSSANNNNNPSGSRPATPPPLLPPAASEQPPMLPPRLYSLLNCHLLFLLCFTATLVCGLLLNGGHKVVRVSSKSLAIDNFQSIAHFALQERMANASSDASSEGLLSLPFNAVSRVTLGNLLAVDIVLNALNDGADLPPALYSKVEVADLLVGEAGGSKNLMTCSPGDGPPLRSTLEESLAISTFQPCDDCRWWSALESAVHQLADTHPKLTPFFTRRGEKWRDVMKDVRFYALGTRAPAGLTDARVWAIGHKFAKLAEFAESAALKSAAPKSAAPESKAPGSKALESAAPESAAFESAAPAATYAEEKEEKDLGDLEDDLDNLTLLNPEGLFKKSSEAIVRAKRDFRWRIVKSPFNFLAVDEGGGARDPGEGCATGRWLRRLFERSYGLMNPHYVGEDLLRIWLHGYRCYLLLFGLCWLPSVLSPQPITLVHFPRLLLYALICAWRALVLYTAASWAERRLFASYDFSDHIVHLMACGMIASTEVAATCRVHPRVYVRHGERGGRRRWLRDEAAVAAAAPASTGLRWRLARALADEDEPVTTLTTSAGPCWKWPRAAIAARTLCCGVQILVCYSALYTATFFHSRLEVVGGFLVGLVGLWLPLWVLLLTRAVKLESVGVLRTA